MTRNKITVKKNSALSRVLAQRTGDWMLAHVDDWLERSIEHRRDPGWFHPSSLGDPCDARLAFAFMDIEPKGTVAARGRRILDLGTSRDEDWKRYLNKSKLSLNKHWGGSPEERELASAERYIEIPHIKIRGECDDIIANPVMGDKYVFEFKTMNQEEWNNLRSPKPEHVLQVHPYMFAKGILQAVIVYENKNTQAIKTYTKRFDHKLWKSVEMRLQNIIELIESKQLPWRTPMQNDSRCQFYHVCQGFQFTEEG